MADTNKKARELTDKYAAIIGRLTEELREKKDNSLAAPYLWELLKLAIGYHSLVGALCSVGTDSTDVLTLGEELSSYLTLSAITPDVSAPTRYGFFAMLSYRSKVKREMNKKLGGFRAVLGKLDGIAEMLESLCYGFSNSMSETSSKLKGERHVKKNSSMSVLRVFAAAKNVFSGAKCLSSQKREEALDVSDRIKVILTEGGVDLSELGLSALGEHKDELCPPATYPG